MFVYSIADDSSFTRKSFILGNELINGVIMLYTILFSTRIRSAELSYYFYYILENEIIVWRHLD